MAQGWISVYRQLRGSWLWSDKPFSKGQAWIDLLLRANHADRKVPLGNEIVEVERGSFITSEVKLSDNWGWSRKKVRVFLSVLERDLMIYKKGTTKYTSITIVNYSLYQNMGTTEDATEEQQKNINGTATEQRWNTNNNDNNDNNENNGNKESKENQPTSANQPCETCGYFKECIKRTAMGFTSCSVWKAKGD